MNLKHFPYHAIGRTVRAAFTIGSFSAFSFIAAASPASSGSAIATPWRPPAPIFSREPRAVTVPVFAPPTFKSRLADVPDAGELREFRALGRPLLAAPDREITAEHRRKTARALERYVEKAYERPSVRLEALREHVRSVPDSPFAVSLWLEISLVAQKSGDFVLAMQAAQEAWQKARDSRSLGEVLEQAEHALSNLATIYVRLGQRLALSGLLTEVIGRASHPASSARLAEARATLAKWDTDPDTAAMCGVTAYNTLAALSGEPLLHKPTQEWAEEIASEALGDSAKRLQDLATYGMSAAQLAARVQGVGSDWRWIKRISGAAIPTPSVVHLQFGAETGHYSALTQGDADSSWLVDHYLGLNGLLENATLNGQASGYFMVPGSRPLPGGFTVASGERVGQRVRQEQLPFGQRRRGLQ